MKKYLLLGSRVALGVYVPAIILARRLEKEGQIVDFVYLEELYEGKEGALEKNKLQFHKNFKLAKAGHILPNRNVSSIDENRKAMFLEKCKNEEYDSIIIFSGFWIKIMEDLVKSSPLYNDRVKAVHMDATYSNSWKNCKNSFIKEIWLFNKEKGEVKFTLDTMLTVENKKRENRIVVHGGGWGMGEYSSKIRELNDNGYELDIIIYYKNELVAGDNFNKYYLLDPEWKPNKEEKEFPRLMVYDSGEWKKYEPEKEALGSPIISLIRKAKAVLSKPGGGTLLDSMITKTPIIFSEELAPYEKINKELWIDKGFGVDFYDWMNAENRDSMLEKMNDNLQNALSKIYYVEG